MRALMHESVPRVVALDFSAVPNLEFTALRMLTDGEEKLREEGTMLWLVAMNPDVLAVVQHSPLWERLGRERMFFTLEQAVETYQQQGGQRA
jgi:MFS superfamily sulfate permease-like transporter